MSHDPSLSTTAIRASREIPRRLISIPTVAERWECSEKTVRRLISQGKLTGYRVGPRLLRVDEAEVAALVRQIPAGGDAA